MTDLLSALASRTRSSPDRDARRPLVVGAALAGLGAPLGVLAGCAALALAGWYDADGGGHGTTKDALRVATDAWLLAHGSGLDVGGHQVTAVPLGLTALCGLVAMRLGQRAAATSDVPDARSAGQGVVVLAGVYAVVAVVLAVLAGGPGASPHPGRAFLGAAVVGCLGGGGGVALGSGLLPTWRHRLARHPWAQHAAAACLAAAAAVLLMFAAGSLLVAGALVAHFGDAATISASLDPGLLGGLLSVVALAAVAPNAALLGCAYLLGPGFAVGTGTLVAPTEVTLGPLPAVPLLGGLPDPGPAPAWTSLLVAVPVLLAAVAGLLAARACPAPGYAAAVGRGAAGGVLGGLGLTLLVAAAGGAVGPGRMADVGADPLPTLLAAVLTLGLGGLLGWLGATFWQRRSSAGQPAVAG